MLSMDLRCVLLCCVLAGGGMTMGGQGETPRPKSKSQGESSRSRQETRESQKSARDLVKREGENRPDDAMTFEILGRPMVLTGEVETRTRFRAGLARLSQLGTCKMRKSLEINKSLKKVCPTFPLLFLRKS